MFIDTVVDMIAFASQSLRILNIDAICDLWLSFCRNYDLRVMIFSTPSEGNVLVAVHSYVVVFILRQDSNGAQCQSTTSK